MNDFTGRYHDDVNVNQWNFYLLHTCHITKTVSSSDVAIIDVCIYFAPRFAPITIPNYASSVLITISSYDTCMSCHVMSCRVMLWHAIVYGDMLVYCMLLYVCT